MHCDNYIVVKIEIFTTTALFIILLHIHTVNLMTQQNDMI